MSKIPAEHDETDAINALINSKLILSSQISRINFSFVSGNRLRIQPIYTEDFLYTHAEHIHYIEFNPTRMDVYNAIWNSSTQEWGYVGKSANLT